MSEKVRESLTPEQVVIRRLERKVRKSRQSRDKARKQVESLLQLLAKAMDQNKYMSIRESSYLTRLSEAQSQIDRSERLLSEQKKVIDLARAIVSKSPTDETPPPPSRK